MIPISVCIITKNEAENLKKCLEAVHRYPFEIVVVDTGSTDNSIEIARSYTEKVYEFTWVDDFSAARNFAAEHASHNIIFPVDTDEFITEFDWEELQTQLSQNPKSVGSIKRLDYFETDGKKRCQICVIDRIYNRRYYQYTMPVHETLAPLTKAPYHSYSTAIEMEHVGYLGSEDLLRQKAVRDMQLLLKELEREPENPYYYFQIAQSYMLMRDSENALLYFQQALSHNPDPMADYTHVLLYNYGHLLLEQGRTDEAAFLLDYCEYYRDDMDYLCLTGLFYLHQNQPLKALTEFVNALTAPGGDLADRREPSYYIGYIYELCGKPEIAKTHYQNCGKDYAPAVEALSRLSQNLSLSLCIIGKNEEKNIEKCLEPLTRYPFEIVYVDTGSTDRTKELAAKYTNHIYDFEWIDDFSAARNFSLSKASHNYVLVLDCDEYLTALDLEALHAAIKAHPHGVGQILRKSYTGADQQNAFSYERIDRLFSKENYHYIYLIHEQVADIRTGSTDYERYDIPLEIDHFGYVGSADEMRSKAERNNALLFREIERHPEEPYFYFQVAQSYNLINDYENAYRYYKKAFSLPLNLDNMWVHVMANNFIAACIQTNRNAEALSLYLPVYDDYAMDSDFLCHIGSLYLNLTPSRPMQAMMEFIKVLQAPVSLEGVDLSGAAFFGMGYANELLGNVTAARDFYEKSAQRNYAAALQKLEGDTERSI